MRGTLLLLLLAATFLHHQVAGLFFQKRQTGPVDPDEKYNTSGLIASKGYPVEECDVVTSDGYILTVQRIPGGRDDKPSKAVRPVVLLWHGLLSISSCWVNNFANDSLGFMLADAGFDVWLGNSRGNTYGRRHKTLNTTDKAFWQFSWDQMAQQDLPAAIDRILAITGASSLFYGGHSQGGAIMYALMSHDPSYATKVKLFVALAPAVYMNTMTSPIKYLAPFSKGLGPIGELLTHGELLPHSEVYDYLAKNVCNQAIIPELFCENLMFVVSGFDVEQMNISRVPVYMGTHPAGTSIQNLLHFAQMVENPNFQMYDYGPAEKMKIYHQKTPPVYDMSKIKVPIAIYHGTNDWLVGPTDVTRLIAATPTLVSKKLISGWEHLDFIWALDAPQQCYYDVIASFKKML